MNQWNPRAYERSFFSRALDCFNLSNLLCWFFVAVAIAATFWSLGTQPTWEDGKAAPVKARTISWPD